MTAIFAMLVIGMIVGFVGRDVVEILRITRPDRAQLPPATARAIERSQKRCKADLNRALRGRQPIAKVR